MAQVELAHAPRLVAGRSGDDQALAERRSVERIHLRRRLDPPAHPDAVRLIVSRLLGHDGSARALRADAEEYLGSVRANAAERRLRAVVHPGEARPPTHLLEPGLALDDAGDVEDR